jgi:LysR family hydrogen peroxide-inducible transcriptional activator
VPITHLAVPAGDPLASAGRVTFAQVDRVLVPRGLVVGPAARPAPEPVDDPLGAVDLVAAGRGLLPVPQLLVDTVRRPDVVFVLLAERGLRLTFGLVWPPERPSEEVMALVQATQEVCEPPAGRVVYP